jgi:opacity protein-like surface antigen
MRPMFPLALSLLLVPASAQAQAGREAQERAAKKACLVGDTARGVEILTDLFVDTNDPTYIFNQGRCYEQNRLYEQAISRFREYLVKAKNASPEERADASKHITDCQAYMAEAEAKKVASAAAEPPPPPFPGQPPADGVASGSPTVVEPPQVVAHNRRKPFALWLAVGAGTGGAYHGLQAVDTRTRSDATGVAVPVAAGFSRASMLQIEPELGVQVTERFALAVFLRYQYAPKDDNAWTPQADENAIRTSALAGFLRAEFSYLNLGNFRSYLTAGAGLGTSFLAVVGKDCDPTSCPLSHSDTLHGGMLGILAGLGAAYHLTSNFSVFFDVKEIVTFRTILALTEFNLGLAVAVDLF